MPLIVTPYALEQRSALYHQIASLLTAGVALIQTLEMARNSVRIRSLQAALLLVGERLQAGSTFTEAIADAPGAFSPFERSLLDAGEQSGRLPECCRSLSDHYAERARLARQVIANLIYPLLLVHLAVLIFPASQLSALVMNPDFIGFATRKLMILLPCYAIVLVLISLLQSDRNRYWRALLERLFHRIPVVGSARRSLALARLASSLEALISAGVLIIESWQTAALASGSPMIASAVSRWKPRMNEGETPGALLQESHLFPELFVSLYLTGEVSGRLDESLRRVYHYYQEEASRKLEALARWIPRLVYLLVLLSIAWQVIGFYKGYFDQLTPLLDP